MKDTMKDTMKDMEYRQTSSYRRKRNGSSRRAVYIAMMTLTRAGVPFRRVGEVITGVPDVIMVEMIKRGWVRKVVR